MGGNRKINVLLCNNRFFISGGPERYLFSIQGALENEGHKVVPFSISYANNKPSPYEKFFASPPGDNNHVYYKDTVHSPIQKIKLFYKTVYNFEAAKKLKEAISKEKIDLVYTLQIVNFLYSAVVNESWKMGVPVISRFSDFQLICPAYTFFRNGEVCEECKQGYFNAVKNRCLQDSYGVSLARVLAMYAYRFLKIQDKIDMIVAPSKFLQNKLIEYGVDKTKVVHIPTYLNPENYLPHYQWKPYVLYVGNFLKYKGIDILIKAFKRIDKRVGLKIVGKANNEEDLQLKRLVEDEGMTNVEFLGFQSGKKLAAFYQEAMFVVVPSVCYENMPNVILEAFAYGKPVIGSKIGSIAELIDDNIDGLYFQPTDVDDLTEKIQYLLDNKDLLPKMGKQARVKVERDYNSKLHYQRLMDVFQKALKNKGK